MPARSNRPEPTPLSAQPFSYAALQNTTTTTPSREGTRNRGRIGRSAECRFFFLQDIAQKPIQRFPPVPRLQGML